VDRFVIIVPLLCVMPKSSRIFSADVKTDLILKCIKFNYETCPTVTKVDFSGLSFIWLISIEVFFI
jgi:hypothetical protein